MALVLLVALVALVAANRETNRQLPTAQNHSGRGNVQTNLTEINIVKHKEIKYKTYWARDTYIF